MALPIQPRISFTRLLVLLPSLQIKVYNCCFLKAIQDQTNQSTIDTPTNTNEPYLDWLNYLKGLSDDEIPQTVTTSYGDNEQTVPISYAVRVCNDFAQLGARGVSLLFSSGDGGVSGGTYSIATILLL